MEYSFTAEISNGYYEICITNKNVKENNDIKMSIRYGLGIQDYSLLPRTKDLKPAELDDIVAYLQTLKAGVK